MEKVLQLLFLEYYLSYVVSVFYFSFFEEVVIFIVDGVGEWVIVSICYGKGKDICILCELYFFDLLGLFYFVFIYYLGFKVNFGEYKLMGLVFYGDLEVEQIQCFIVVIKSDLIDFKVDGLFKLYCKYFCYVIGQCMIDDKCWEVLFGIFWCDLESIFE